MVISLAGIIIQMQFSSVPKLIDAYLDAQLRGTAFKGVSLFLYVAKKNPLLMEDAGKVRLTASQDDLQAYFQSYDKISEASNICLENVEVHIEYGKGYRIQGVELSSKSVIADVGEKENKLKSFQLKVSLEQQQGQFPLAISTFQYVKRLERQELVKKHYKPSKVEVTSFVAGRKGQKAKEEQENGATPQLNSLDTESVFLLRKLLQFTDKGELFRVLLKKPLKDRQAKKAVRLSIIPTDVEESEGFEVKKKQFSRNTVQELLGEYEAREQRMRE